MTDWLVQRFVKNSECVTEQSVRTSYGVLASIVGIICNTILFLIKFIIGLIIGSITVTADSFNNLSDAASSIVGLVGVKLASRPADKEHPFGHGRAEYIAALVVAFLVIEVGFTCFKSSFDKILHPELVKFQPVLVGILVVSVLLKVWLSMFNKKLGTKINSKVMLATATDARGDVIITSATVVSIVIGAFTGLAIDGYAGVVVSVFVLIAGVNIARDTLEPLLGEAIDRTLYDEITQKVESYEGILGSHDLIVHMYGPSRKMASIHAEVPNDSTLDSAHNLIDQIEHDIMDELDVFLVIHIDPVEVNNELIKEKKSLVQNIVKQKEEKASIHDFRYVECDHQTNLIFDLVVPHGYSKKEEHELLLYIIEKVRDVDPKYQCIITIETSYVRE